MQPFHLLEVPVRQEQPTGRDLSTKYVECVDPCFLPSLQQGDDGIPPICKRINEVLRRRDSIVSNDWCSLLLLPIASRFAGTVS